MAERAYRGVPAAQRQAVRRAALVEAVLDCLHDDGIAGTGVRAVCARAQLTQRYFYENFADLDALLLAVVDSVMDEIASSSLAALRAVARRRPDDVAGQVRAALAAGYGVVALDRRKADVLLTAAAGNEALRERRHRAVTDYANLVLDGLPLLHGLELSHRRRARALSLFLVAGSFDVIEAVLAGRLRMSRERLVDQLTAMWLGALSAALPGTDPSARG